MSTKQQIETFLEPKKFAIAGVSRNPKKFGHSVYTEMKKKGYAVYPINPHAETIDGEKCYASVGELPADVRHLLIVTPKPDTDAVLRAAIDKGMTHVWIQQMSETPETLDIARERVELITGRCIFMFTEPTGMHKFHRGLMGFFGKLPK
jgi:predicted CoA-binding protein